MITNKQNPSSASLVERVMQAQTDNACADTFIRENLPFIRSEISKVIHRFCDDHTEEYSIGMLAFYEALRGYQPTRGAFFSFAALHIRSRLTDYLRKIRREQSFRRLDEPDETGRTLADTLPDKTDYFEESATRQATRQELTELGNLLKSCKLSFADIADNSPKQERTKAVCLQAIRAVASDETLLKRFEQTKKLPLAELQQDGWLDRKTLERHRKYLVAMLLIQTNGFVLLRNHVSRVIWKKGAQNG